MIGKTISHYKIMEKLGEGGMGVVYKAEDLKLKRTVALKFLPSELTRDQEANQRFIQEAQAASSLDHQNVCTIYEIDETNDGQTFIVMACYDGEVLKDKIQTGPLNIEQAVDIIIQVAEGLKKTHAKGIVHRDIKPANIFITEDGVAKILDFGLAKLAAPAHLTKTGRTLGTVAYMSPEQAKGDKIDHRTDIWSLGVVLYEMLTGQLPFKGEYEHAVIYSILNEEPETIVTGRNDIPPALEQIVYKCLEKQAADRYETAKQLLNDLNKLSDKSIKQKPGPPATKVKVRKRSSQYVIAAFLFMVAIALIVKFGLLREKIKEPKIINVRSITTSASISRWATQISPDGAYVTYASDESGNRDIWVQQISTGQKINLTKDYDGFDSGGNWSPDGNWIAFASTRDNGGIYVVSQLGGLPRKVVDHDLQNLGIDGWSPDGLKLTYTIAGTLYTVPANGGVPEYVPLAHNCGMLNWSPDGDRIVYVTGFPILCKQLWTVNPDGSDPVLVLDTPGMIQAPQWSNDGKRIFFKSMKGGVRDIWWVPVNRKGNAVGSARQLTFGADAFEFSISKDGSKMAYARDVGSNSAIYAIPLGIDRILTMEDATQILSQKEGMINLAISPDHQWFAFNALAGGKVSIWLARTNGQDLRQLTADSSNNFFPSFSPDGKWIAFHSNRKGNNDVYIMPAAGGPVTALTHDQSNDYAPSWSADGKKIVFNSDRSGNWDLWSVSVNGGDLKQLTFDRANDVFPECSPDGHYICFVSKRTGLWQLYLLPTAGGELRQLSKINAYGLGGQAWAPDGKTVYFTYYLDENDTNRKFAAVSVEDGSLRKIMEFKGSDVRQWDLVADSEKLYFTNRSSESNIWLADLVYE